MKKALFSSIVCIVLLEYTVECKLYEVLEFFKAFEKAIWLNRWLYS